VIAVHIVIAGTAPQRDEGAAAHLWQVLMVGQVPIIGYFAATSIPSSGGKALVVLTGQLLAALAAAVPVFILRW
jgi:hypothetical protein